MRLGIEHERHRKAERDHCDKDRQNPLGRVVSGHNRRAYLDDEPSNHCIAKRDAIHFPLFQLTEEGAHSDPGRLRSIGYSRHSVELGSGSVISLLPGPHGFEPVGSTALFIRAHDELLSVAMRASLALLAVVENGYDR